MVRAPQNEYGSAGSVPYDPSVAPTGLGAPSLSARANPEDFGAQVGQGVQKVGGAAEQAANMYGGLVLETAANQAELSYIKATGDLKAKYSKYEGLQAEAMRPQYEADLDNIHQQFRSNLPSGAQRMFDGNTIRSLGNQTSEYASYAAGQVKNANLQSNDALADASIAKAGNLPSVTDPSQFGEMNGTIVHAANAVADIRGWAALSTGVDADTGKLTFGDSPEAQATKAQYDNYIADKQSKLYLTAAKTVADKHGAAAAADWAKDHWDMMPDKAKVEMNQFIAPKMKNETISGSIANQNQQLESGWNAHLISNVPNGPDTQVQKTPLDVIRQNEGYTGKIGKDSNGANVLNGINEKSFPAEYAEAKNLLDTKGKAAADAYADNFYQKNILDKYDIKSLPANTQAIVADGLVNHGAGTFGQSLIQAAKDGKSPQELIDMRRAEYQRLAASDVEGKKGYAQSLKGWNNRLDQLQQGSAAQGVFANKKDYLESQKQDYVNNSVNDYLKQYPDDYYGSQLTERRATAEINRQISVESGKLKSDRDNIDNAINGAFTKGQSPRTIGELQAIPGVQPILDRSQREQGEFYNSIDTKLAKASHGSLSTNSPNAYDAITSVLDRETYHDRQSQIEYLSKGLGSDNPGYSISWKDFNDAKPAIDLDDNAAKLIREQMVKISSANGNYDGQGNQRAVKYYNDLSAVLKANNAKGDSKQDISDVISNFNEKINPPSSIKQISNWATSLFESKPPTPSPTVAVNPKTGEKLVLKDGKWHPMQ